jgi:hypothetical protein
VEGGFGTLYLPRAEHTYVFDSVLYCGDSDGFQVVKLRRVRSDNQLSASSIGYARTFTILVEERAATDACARLE